MIRPRLSEGELVAAIWDATDYKSALTARILLKFAHDNGLLIREREASVSVRIALGPGERPATLFVISNAGRFYCYWLDHWPQRFQGVARAYERALRGLFGKKRVIGPQGASIGIVGLRDVADEMRGLRRLILRTVTEIREINSAGAAVLPDVLVGLEGEARRRMILHRKREGWLRDARIAFVKQDTGGLGCEVTTCGFDFEASYGPLGKDYAQVHHVRPLSARTAPEKTRVSDLRVVCANCHAMIHVGGKSRSLPSIGQALRSARASTPRTKR